MARVPVTVNRDAVYKSSELQVIKHLFASVQKFC